MGFTVLRTLGDAYSERYTAEPRPSGTATRIAIPVIRKVPFRSGQIPNWGSANRGVHLPSVKKSKPTSLKKGIDSLSRATRIPTVVRIEITAARKRSARMTSSPGRRRRWRREG